MNNISTTFLRIIFPFLTLLISCQNDEMTESTDSKSESLSLEKQNQHWESLITTEYALGYVPDTYSISGIASINLLKVFDHDDKLYLVMNYRLRDLNDVIVDDFRYYEFDDSLKFIRSSSNRPPVKEQIPFTSQKNGYWFRAGSFIESTLRQREDFYGYRSALAEEFDTWYQYEIYPTAKEGNLSGGERNFTEAKGLNSKYLATAYYIQNYIQTGNEAATNEYPVEYGIWLDDYSGASDKAIPFDTLIFRPFDRQYRRSLQFGALYEPRYFSTNIRVDQVNGQIMALTARDTAIRDAGSTVRWNPTLFLSLGNQNDAQLTLLDEIPFQEKPRDPSRVLQFFEQEGNFYLSISFAEDKGLNRIYTIQSNGKVSYQDVSSDSWNLDYPPEIFVLNNSILTYDLKYDGANSIAQLYEIQGGSLIPFDDPISFDSDFHRILQFHSTGNELYLLATKGNPDYAPCCPDAYTVEILKLK